MTQPPQQRIDGRSGAARTIIEVSHVSKEFTSPDGSPLPVLEDISLQLVEGEIVALLGRSGSGKSTLLRCIAGLIEPSQGQISYRGAVLNGACHGVSMVFQSFALLPWLTVRQNVELGLEARGVGPAERRGALERAIDTIGLDGFESAYPKELSGGMRQRVGFARALVVEPDAAPDGRAVFGARRAYRAEPAGRTAAAVDAKGLPDQGDADRDAQHRRGGCSGGPDLRPWPRIPAGSARRLLWVFPNPGTATTRRSRAWSTRSTGS